MKHLWFVMVLLLGGLATIAQAAKDNNPEPPKDAMWTINCRSFSGPDRVVLANRAKDAVKKLTGWKEWYVIHQEDESTLFYGYYKGSPLRGVSGGDEKDAQRAQKDWEKIKGLRDEANNQIFRFAYPVQIPRPGSEGPAEWDLRNTPGDRYWSLLIGEYRDNPDSKKAAVEAVKVLRAEGAEAYYLHGPVSSLVCVGAWPRSAMKEQQTDGAEPDDPDTIIKVYNVPLPDRALTEYYDQEGRHYKIFAPKVEITDPKMRATIDHYPYFHTNGEVFGKRMKTRDGKERLVPNPSQLLIIPRKGAMLGGNEEQAKPAAPAAPLPVPAKPKDEPGMGKLKSLD